MTRPAGPVDGDARRRAIEEAARWYARMLPGAHDLGEDAAHVRQGFERWLAAAPHHAQAWHAVQAMGTQLDAIPPHVATTVLGRRKALAGAMAVAQTKCIGVDGAGAIASLVHVKGMRCAAAAQKQEALICLTI